MNPVKSAFRGVARVADTTTAAAGAVGGAAVNGVVGGIQGAANGVRTMVRGALVRAFAATRAHALHPERPLAELPHAKVPVAMADAALRSAAEREWYVANRMVEDKVPWELGDRRRLERKHDRPSTLAEFGAKWGWLAEGRRGGRMRWREVPAVCSRGGRPRWINCD